MRLLVQRVTDASVSIDGCPYSKIGRGLLLFIGVGVDDGTEDVEYLAQKVVKMRIFDDQAGIMNFDLQQVEGQVMIVSQFTLQASTRKGNRPSYIRAAGEGLARPLYEKFTDRVAELLGREVATGQFGADMQVSLTNDGPVTIWLDTKQTEY